MYIWLRFQYAYFVSTKTIKQNYQTLYFQLAHNKFYFVFYFKLNHHTLLFCILCLKINTKYEKIILSNVAQFCYCKFFAEIN